jgi:hypothetical protein
VSAGASTLQVITTTDRRGAETFGLDLGHALRTRGRAVNTVALVKGRGGALLPVRPLGPSRLELNTLPSLRSHITEVDVVVAHGSSTLPACFLSTIGTKVPFIYRSVGDPTFWARTPPRRARTAGYLARATAVVSLTRGAAAALNRGYGVPRSQLHVSPKEFRRNAFRPLAIAAWRPSTSDRLRSAGTTCSPPS